jgi:hypothetical protein
MNTAVMQTEESAATELMTIQDTSQIMLDEKAMDRVMTMGKLMSSGKSTIPKHLQGNQADCTAIAMQSLQWRMNPFAVAQKTHLVHGNLGYEAQLINAVITTLAPIVRRPEYEFLGDWSKILGKIKEMKGDNGKYYVSDWPAAAEEGLGVIVSCQLKGEEQPRKLTLMMSQCFPRFSTQWATDPQQQITYAALRKWSRRYTPDVILGVYSDEEAESMPHIEKDITPGNFGQQNTQAGATAYLTDDEFFQHEPTWKAKWLRGVPKGLTLEPFKTWVYDQTGKHLTPDMVNEVINWKADAPKQPDVIDGQASTITDPAHADFVADMNKTETGNQQ